MSPAITIPSLWPVTSHTDYVGKNSTFVAIKGFAQDGIDFVPLALKKGATKIVAEYTADISQEIIELIKAHEAELIFVPDARRSLALLAADAWDHPASKLKIIAITGTKGKTTTAWLLHHMLMSAGKKAALLSTVKNKIGHQQFDTQLTTQHPDYLHAFFNSCVSAGMEYVVMEVAAQAFSLHRVAGLNFHGLIFTNFASAHGEFYTNEHEYYQAKRALFNQCVSNNACLSINADDAKGIELLDEFPSAISYGASSQAALKTVGNINSFKGIEGEMQVGNESYAFTCPSLIGTFNVSNILAASSMAYQLGLSWQHIIQTIATFGNVPGRLERYDLPNGAVSFIDHAHNPLSFDAVLPLLRSMTNHLIVVAGAGGDRDRSMRPVLGHLMSQYADVVIITADNPRSENPAAIIAAISAGIPADKKDKVVCEVDRQKAIEIAYSRSQAGTIIALLGKGPEEYQIIGPSKIPFSERYILQNLSNV